MKKTTQIALLSTVFLSMTGVIPHAQAAPPALSVQEPYVRLVPPGITVSAAFMTIDNTGTTDRQLARAESPLAGTVELHTHVNDNGVMKMRAVSAIPIPAKGQAQLKPGGDHIMLIGLKAALQEGRDVPITLYFDDGSHLTVMAPIKKPSAGSPTPNGTMKH